jgi:dienelactone hydrolase
MAAAAAYVSAACGTALPTAPSDAGRTPSAHTERAASSNDGREQRIEFRSSRGRLVSAVVLVGLAADRRLPGIVLQQDIGGHAELLLPEGRALAAAGAVVLLPDWALGGEGWPSDDFELWQCATADVQRSFDVLTARADVDPERLAFLGVGFGASVGAILATTDPRVCAFALVEPEADSRAGSVRWRWNLEHPESLPPSGRQRLAKAHPPVLIQLGVVERDSSDEDLSVWDKAAAAGDQVRWYESAYEPAATAARESFLASHLAQAAPRTGR